MIRMRLPDEPNTYIDVFSERGAIVANYVIGGRHLFYMDDEMGMDAPIIRGGVPILFPVCGPVHDGKYSVQGQEWPMPQHGFIRDMAWSVSDSLHSLQESKLMLTVTDSAYSHRFYPYAFRLNLVYVLQKSGLRVEMTIYNLSNTAMPVQIGFHPYFNLPDKKDFECHVPDTAFEDGLTGQTYEGGLAEVLHAKLHDEVTNLRCHFPHGDIRVGLDTADWEISVEPDDPFKTIVFWSLAGKPFICVEPWSGSPGHLNRGTTQWLEAGNVLHVGLTIRARCKKQTTEFG
ncbi:hypothetical protein JZ786_23935 [Alicyclobacillus mengziensis]|uniref:Aldose 1-epimerase n=2 Tax=Alicyclobacillus mengziensis TaxID=2931921 RepID=A0A9X7VYG9_9BACL|nr:hypothetical protein JZ786_23935 [Alicyclobacillus mengziensis]